MLSIQNCNHFPRKQRGSTLNPQDPGKDFGEIVSGSPLRKRMSGCIIYKSNFNISALQGGSVTSLLKTEVL